MPRIANRFHGPALVTNAAVTKFTVAAGELAIIRHIHVSNPSASAVDITMSIGTDAAAVRIFDGYPIPADSVLDHFCYYVMTAAEFLQALASTTNILTLTIDGERSVVG
jgi:hypothetical protein